MTNNKEKNFVSAVIYIHNYEAVLNSFLPTLFQTLQDNFNTYEIIFVDDYSMDNSVDIIKQYVSQVDNVMVHVIHMSLYQGLEISMNAGVDLAIGDYIFEFDSPLMDYDPFMIMQVYREALKGYDIVTASPEVMKRKSSRFFYAIYNRSSKCNYKLRSDSFRILSRRAINRVQTISSVIPYRKAVYANCGLRMQPLLYKAKSATNYSFSRQVKERRKDIAIDTFILFTDIANKISFVLSMVFLLLTMLSGVYTCVVFWGQHRPVAGWTTTMLLMSLSFFGVFLLFSIVIKYLSVLINLVFKKQKYLIESTETLSNSK